MFEDDENGSEESTPKESTPHPLEEKKESITKSQFDGMLSDISSKTDRTLYLSESKLLRRETQLANLTH